MSSKQDYKIPALTPDEAAKLWAERLNAARDYHSLAAYLCAYHRHPHDSGYDYSVALWNAKNSYARDILFKAGAEAVDAMLAEMESGEDKDIDVAEILVRIGDPKAVPLLKKFDDRGEWSSYSFREHITKFVNKYP